MGSFTFHEMHQCCAAQDILAAFSSHLEGLERQHDPLLIGCGTEEIWDVEYACVDLLHPVQLRRRGVEGWQPKHCLGQIAGIQVPGLRFLSAVAVRNTCRGSPCDGRCRAPVGTRHCP